MDSDVWEDPATFRPERFIGKEGKIVNREKVIPFSVV
jgi:cytochrome P450